MKYSKIDYFNKNAECIKQKKLFLFDMDGTIYREEELFDGTLELLDAIQHKGGEYVFLTNNSSKSVHNYIEKVNRLGIKANVDNFFTSSQATILYLKENYPEKRVYCQGTKSLVQELKDAGIEVETEASDSSEVILVGFDTELTTKKMYDTCKMLQRNLPYIATNPDLACPVSFGYIPDCGSICKMYETITGKKPVYIGKPEPEMVNIVRKKMGYTCDETVLIGDRLYTDIAAGINANVTSVCVLTGEATVDDIKKSNIKPIYTFESVKDIYCLFL